MPTIILLIKCEMSGKKYYCYHQKFVCEYQNLVDEYFILACEYQNLVDEYFILVREYQNLGDESFILARELKFWVSCWRRWRWRLILQELGVIAVTLTNLLTLCLCGKK